MELEGKVAIVTGGASGIGAACCRAFASQGARVAVVDRNEAGAADVAKEIGGLAVGCNVGDEGSVQKMVATVTERLGPVDICFNNAGIGSGGDVFAPPGAWNEQ